MNTSHPVYLFLQSIHLLSSINVNMSQNTISQMSIILLQKTQKGDTTTAQQVEELFCSATALQEELDKLVKDLPDDWVSVSPEETLRGAADKVTLALQPFSYRTEYADEVTQGYFKHVQEMVNRR